MYEYIYAYNRLTVFRTFLTSKCTMPISEFHECANNPDTYSFAGKPSCWALKVLGSASDVLLGKYRNTFLRFLRSLAVPLPCGNLFPSIAQSVSPNDVLAFLQILNLGWTQERSMSVTARSPRCSGARGTLTTIILPLAKTNFECSSWKAALKVSSKLRQLLIMYRALLYKSCILYALCLLEASTYILPASAASWNSV